MQFKSKAEIPKIKSYQLVVHAKASTQCTTEVRKPCKPSGQCFCDACHCKHNYVIKYAGYIFAKNIVKVTIMNHNWGIIMKCDYQWLFRGNWSRLCAWYGVGQDYVHCQAVSSMCQPFTSSILIFIIIMIMVGHNFQPYLHS